MKKLILPISFLLILSSCSEQEQRKTVDENETDETAVVYSDEKSENSYYPIPSPEQMFNFINDNGIAYDKTLVHDVALADLYQDPTAKTLVFGIYTADLAYVAAYQDVESTIKYYKIVRKLSIELNIQELMSEEMMQKMQVNMENPDSLAVIAGDSYYKAVEHLESNGQQDKLALMSLGGWIESVYITLSTIGDANGELETLQRIADQKITFDNLYTYLSDNSDKVGVKAELEKLVRIKALFDSLQEGGSTESTKKEGGKLVFGKAKKIQITPEQLVELKSAVEEYRTQVIGQNN